MARDASARRARLHIVGFAIGLGLVACLVVAVLQAHLDQVDSLSVVLGIAAVAAGISVTRLRGGGGSLSASFIVLLLAAAFLGSASACIAVAISELTAAGKLRTPRFAVAANLLSGLAPALVAANMVRLLAPARSDTATFYLVMCAAGVAAIVINCLIVVPFQQLYRGSEGGLSLRTLRGYAPAAVLNILLAVAGASVYLKVGLGGIVFALLAVFAFSYMAYLVTTAENRADQYRDLSWGVLAGLVRALDARDQRAARHSAAVARFARDLARATGFEERDCELAHTAGLLHDIGRFALSDRVSERGRTLSEEDWEAIQRHPALGADMLRDLGVYGPVADIVLSHHERVDGRGYPRALASEEIPALAKIIAVAEVYDTLTAQDTYRTRVSSFEALRELRRVAGTQLDSRYVEAFADLLSGEGVAYRHADDASFDAELDIERRIKDAAQGSA
jgi:putative nucleotidyltransferase with HDIG domain